MLDPGCPVIDVIFPTGTAKYVCACDVVLFAICELNAVVGENGMNGVRKCLVEIGQEGRGNHLCGSQVQLDEGKF